MILASNPDRAVTVRERDLTYPGNDVPGGPRGALVDEVNGDSICDQIPLPHGHGSVNFRFSMIPSSLKFQVSGAPAVLPHSRKKLRGVSVLRSPVSAPVSEECPIHRQINELRPFSIQI